MAEDAPMVMALAAALGVAGLLVFLFFWITIPRTSRPMTVGPGWETAPPDDLPPALASALLSRGASGGSGLIATVVDLARRGAIEIVEVSTDRWRGRKYRLVPTRAAVHEAHERAVLRSLFRGESTGGVDLAAGIRHARRGEGTHREAVAAELLRRRLVSPERIAGKRRLIGVSIALAVIAGMALVVGIVLVSRAGGAVMLPALALGLVAFIGVLVSATFSVLSDEGLRVETRWRGFRKHLNRIAKGRHAIPAEVMDEWLPYAVGLGLGLRWAKQRSKMAERSPMPAWLVPLLQSNGSNGALAALLVAGGANAGAGGAAGAGAAAGGGSSGAS